MSKKTNQSKWEQHREKLISTISEDPSLGYSALAGKCLKAMGLKVDRKSRDSLRKYIQNNLFDERVAFDPEEQSGIDTDTQDYAAKVDEKLTAWDENGNLMSIEQFCETYNLPYDDVTSSKLITHTGVPFYNVVFKEQPLGATRQEVLDMVEERVSTYRHLTPRVSKGNGLATQALSDIHLGQRIQPDMVLRQEHYNVDACCEKLQKIAHKINQQHNSRNDIVLNGDILEAVQLMHISQYREIEADLTGGRGIVEAGRLLNDHLLTNIDNLGKVYMPSSNHGRLGGMNKEENERGEAELLIAHILELRGYDTEFAPVIGKYKMGRVSMMYSHGHLRATKKKTAEIIQEFGYKDDDYVVLLTGHTHDHKAQVKDYNMLEEDRGGYAHLVVPPLTPGGEFSANSGYAGGNSGFLSIWESDNGRADYRRWSV